MSKVPYSIVFSSVMYRMVCTRLDLDFNESMLSRYISNHGSMYWEALEWLLRYLKILLIMVPMILKVCLNLIMYVSLKQSLNGLKQSSR